MNRATVFSKQGDLSNGYRGEMSRK